MEKNKRQEKLFRDVYGVLINTELELNDKEKVVMGLRAVAQFGRRQKVKLSEVSIKDLMRYIIKDDFENQEDFEKALAEGKR